MAFNNKECYDLHVHIEVISLRSGSGVDAPAMKKKFGWGHITREKKIPSYEKSLPFQKR